MTRFARPRKSISFDNGFSEDDAASEADPNDIAKILKDTEDMDGDLFKNLGSKSASVASLSKTMPAKTKSK